MKIAIDIDKTLMDCKSALYEAINSSFVGQKGDKKLKFEHLIGDEFRISKMLGKLNNMYNHKYYTICENCDQIVNKLYEDGHYIILLSSRPKEKHLSATLLYCVDKFEIDCNEIIVACNNKVEYCLQEKVDIFIDNSYVTCTNASMKGITTICYLRNFPVDDLKTNPNLFICSTWEEIEKKVNEIIKDKKQKNKRM